MVTEALTGYDMATGPGYSAEAMQQQPWVARMGWPGTQQATAMIPDLLRATAAAGDCPLGHGARTERHVLQELLVALAVKLLLARINAELKDSNEAVGQVRADSCLPL